MKAPIRHLPDEADIGSGEKSPGHQETEELIRQVSTSDESGRSSTKTPDTGSKREEGKGKAPS